MGFVSLSDSYQGSMSQLHACASADYQSISWGCRAAVNAEDILSLLSGVSSQLVRARNLCETLWPVPRQCTRAQARMPLGRKLSWIMRQKPGARLWQGVPAGVSTGKSAERENPKAVQQRAKRLRQSGRKDARSGAGEMGSRVR